ncbi:nitrate- and nitrite sensing domain-containing protein [Micromonospora sp. CPCC 205539]|uniref:sensor histidine kinase n=1 Tax=Micromonospora sp. CPCC 205539 TaxID=3122408 RepID=UPI002FF23CCC
MPLPAHVRQHRTSRALENLRSIRTQLLAPIMVTIIGLTVLGATQTNAALAATADADRARVLSGTATVTVQLVHELERELGETAALRQRGGTAGRPLVDAQRRRVDTAVERYRSAGEEARQSVPELTPVLSSAEAQLERLSPNRALALAGTEADPAYARTVESLLAVADALPAQLRDPELANAAREVAAVAAQEHLASVERDLLRAVFVRGKLAAGELARLGWLHGAQEQREAEFLRIATGTANSSWVRLMSGADVETAHGMRDAVLETDGGAQAMKTDGDAWFVAQSGTIRRYNLLGRELSEDLDRDAAALARDALWTALLTGGVTGAVALGSLVTAAVLAIRISRRLSRLRAAALAMANHELPERVTAIAAGAESPDESAADAVTAAIARGHDEVAQVAAAFGTVSKTTLRLAGAQAELRLDMTRMAEALARRIRTLITRQLRMLDDFEREETDPQILERLFALDHLAARLRRNGENLLVLAGGEPSRGHEAPLVLEDVVRAAASEIEHYPRVELNLPVAGVQGAAVGSLVHLLAELLENATVYSPPHAPVLVDGRRTVDGLLLRVHDHGIGIRPGRLAAINERLASPAMLSSAAAGSMGLHVVAHLANRYGIQVQLYNTGSGTVAQVDIPDVLLTRVEAVTSHQPVAGRPLPGRPAAWFRQGSKGATGARPLVSAQAGSRGMAPGAGMAKPPDGPPHPAATEFAVGLGAGGQIRGVATVRPPAVPPLPGAAFSPPPGSPPTPQVTAGGLPRRNRGEQLPTNLPTNPPAPPPSRTEPDLLDPEVVRRRLSALAEGVASAARSNPYSTPTGRIR